MAQVDLEKMLTKIKATQWGLGDVDWDAPGRERITPEQWPKLKTFMADLMWIEHVGARGFAAMAKTAPATGHSPRTCCRSRQTSRASITPRSMTRICSSASPKEARSSHTGRRCLAYVRN